MTVKSGVRLALVLGVLVTGACSKDPAPSAQPSAPPSTPPVSSTPSATSTPSASATPSAVVTPSAVATPSAPVTPTPTPTPPKPTPPKPSAAPGTVLTAKGAYLQVSEDENLTNPDPENGCEVHDPDLDDVECGVVSMPGGIATWITGNEQNTLPGQNEPRKVARIYQRLKNGTDSLTYVAIGEPEHWAEIDVVSGSLTGQVRDSLVVIVRFRGSGTMAGYDVVTWRKASPLKLHAHHEEGAKAQIYVRSKGYISTYVADYSDGSPNCCPKAWQHDNVYWDGTQFRLRKFPNVSSPPNG